MVHDEVQVGGQSSHPLAWVVEYTQALKQCTRDVTLYRYNSCVAVMAMIQPYRAWCHGTPLVDQMQRQMHGGCGAMAPQPTVEITREAGRCGAMAPQPTVDATADAWRLWCHGTTTSVHLRYTRFYTCVKGLTWPMPTSNHASLEIDLQKRSLLRTHHVPPLLERVQL